MEERPKINSLEQSEVSKETKETEKKSPKGFLLSYLQTFYPDSLKHHKTEDDDEEESEKKSFLERFVDRIKPRSHKLFEDAVEVEPVEGNESEADRTKAADIPTEAQPQEEVGSLDISSETTQQAANVNQSSEPQTATPEAVEATTIIDHNSEAQTPASEVVEAQTSEVPIEQLTAQRQAPETQAEIFSEAPDAMESGGPDAILMHESPQATANHNEEIRQQEERRLKREVNRLERTARDLETEQRAVRQRQEKFTHDLEKQFKAYEKLHKETLPKLTKTRERLRTRLEKPKPPEVYPQPRDIPKKVEAQVVSVQPNQERLMELANVTPVVAPEVVQHTVEHAAEQNMAIEGAYERRHELKDEPVIATATARSFASSQSGASVGYQGAVDPRIDLNGLNKVSAQLATQAKAPPTPVPISPNKDLYNQAVKNGFWAAIALLIFLGIIMLAK